MKKIKWDKEESVALLDLYYQHNYKHITKAEYKRLSVSLKNRKKNMPEKTASP